LAACAIVGHEHVIISDQAKTATHTTPIAIRTNSLSRIASLLVADLDLYQRLRPLQIFPLIGNASHPRRSPLHRHRISEKF
jgi:hypothetical protein